MNARPSNPNPDPRMRIHGVPSGAARMDQIRRTVWERRAARRARS